MKTSSLIIDEKLTASTISPADFDQRILSLAKPSNVVLLKAGIFSRDGPSPCCQR